MADPSLLPLAAAALAATAMTSAAALRAWSGWLALRQDRLRTGGGQPERGGRSEIAALRNRVRRLEAIVDGADL
jgi:hypothetical protein